MKNYLRILVFLAIWAAITWRFRDHLLPVPKADQSPAPHFRTPEATKAAASLKPVADGADAQQSFTQTDQPAATLAVVPPTADDLTRVKGIGPVYSDRLEEIGIVRFSDLAAGDAASISKQIDVADSVVDDWIRQAANLA